MRGDNGRHDAAARGRSDASPPTPLGEARALRAIFGTFATGVTVITVAAPAPHGITANSFSSVSLDPPLALACVARTSSMHASLLAARAFAVSVLAADQEAVARHFARPGRPSGSAQFDRFGWVPGMQTGAPLIAGALAWFECDLWSSYDGGDHTIFLGRLLSAIRHDADSAATPDALLFHGGRYRYLRESAGTDTTERTDLESRL